MGRRSTPKARHENRHGTTRPRVHPASPFTAVMALVLFLVAAAYVLLGVLGDEPVPSFRAQACGIPERWLTLTERGYFQSRSGQISLMPRYPAYMATGGGGWSHSGPWPYLQDVPLVFYGPGAVEARGAVDTPATLADVAPTLATLVRGAFSTEDGSTLEEVASLRARLLRAEAPKLIVTVVWDGGGWNVLRRYPDEWPNLRRLMQEGASFTEAIVGSSPSVTPSVHTTLGSGTFPRTHGITGVPVRDEEGEVVDAFLLGESSRFVEVPTLAERWDEQNHNRAKVGMVGYEPWHLGMIGKGAEAPSGDKDDAVWLDTETNEWITNEDHYRVPDALVETGGLEDDVQRLDAADGQVDRAWLDNEILDDRARVEETPAFIRYHARALMNLISQEGYGEDRITDLLYTNFKQIDRVGHYFNMDSEEVRQSLAESDRQLGELVDFLDARFEPGEYVLVMTADHGQQPDASDLDSYGIEPTEIEQDLAAEFGPIVRAVWPTEAFLYPDEMERRGVTIEEVARWLADYRLRDNTEDARVALAGAGRFEAGERIMDMAIPARMLEDLDCGGGAEG
ncbi:MAG: alkaline phosphatase family protein [Actinomycetota bacterium]